MVNSITITQVEVLEGIFATFTAEGWVMPAWLICLRQLVIARDLVL